MKVKIKAQKRYRLALVFDFDDRPSVAVAQEGTSDELDKLIDSDLDELLPDGFVDVLDNDKDHITEVMLRVTRL